MRNSKDNKDKSEDNPGFAGLLSSENPITHKLFMSTLAENIPAAVCMFLPDSTIIYANKTTEKITGIKNTELIGRKFFELIDPGDLENVKRSLESLTPDNPSAVHEQIRINGDGETGYQQWRNSAFFDDKGKACSYIGIGVDITEQKKSEIQLRNSEMNFRTFIESLDDMVLIYDRKGRVIYFNPSASAKLGYDAEKMREMTITDLHPSLSGEETEKIISGTFDPGRNDNHISLLHKDGFIIPAETRLSPGKWDGTDCIFCISKDLTNEQEALQKFEKLFRINPAPMAISGIENRVFIDVNNAFVKTLGYTRDEIVGRTSRELGIFIESDEHSMTAQTLLKNGDINDVDLKIRTKDGRIREGLFSGGIISSHGNDYFLTVMTDITERKQAENEIKNLLTEKQIILREVHHRIKNFMNTIKGLISLQMNSLEDPETVSALENIKNRIHSMMILYDKLYLSCKFNELSATDYIPYLVDEIAANFPEASKITITKDINDFKLDAKKFQPMGIIINEILTNIMKHAFPGRDKGSITISAAVSDNRVALVITDDGIGLPESVSFENSTGFGMALVNMLAKQLHGTVKIERGKGTKFILEFDC
jgi:PAS domain S-box-containing protein